MRKRTWLMLACIVMALTMAIGGTLAYLTDTDEAVNTMVMGNVDIEMNEYADAALTTPFVDGKTLLPGDTMDKHVVVENIGSTDAYVRTWIALEYGKNLELKWADGVVPTPVGAADINGVSYELYYVDYPLAVGASFESLSSVAMTVAAGNEDVQAIGNTLDVLVFTQAVQQANLEGTVTEALNTAFYTPSPSNHPFSNMTAGEPANGADVTDQLNNANDSNVYLNIPANTTFDYAVGGTHGTTDMGGANTKQVTIEGNGPSSVFNVTGAGVTEVAAEGDATLVMKNLTVNDSTVAYDEDAWEFGYLEFAGKLRFENVVFDDPITIDGDAEFINCTFTGKTTEMTQYGVWVSAGNASFEGCTFQGTRGLKMHEAYGTDVKSVTVNNCEFVNLSEKPGVAIGTVNGDTAVTIQNSSFINCKAGDQGLYIYETDTDVGTFTFSETNNTVKNFTSYDVSTAEQLLALSAKALTANNNKAETAVINIMNDIDMNGAKFSAIIAQRGDELIINGNGHTISDVKVVSGDNDNTTGQASMFYAYPGSTLEVSNLTLKDVTVKADEDDSGYAAAVIGYCEGTANLRNVDVVNTNVTGAKSSGMLVGHLSGTLNAADCDLSGTVTLSDYETDGHYAGKYIGTLAGSATLNTCTANVTLSGNLNVANIGEVFGRNLGTLNQ